MPTQCWPKAAAAMHLACACLLGLLGGCSESPAEQPPARAPAEPPPVNVTVAAAEAGPLVFKTRYLGRVEAYLRAPVAAGVAGIVESVEVRPGDQVAEGQRLASLDRRLIEPRIAAARAETRRIDAELSQARAELKRVRTLRAPVVTEAELERFESRVAVLSAQRNASVATVEALEAERSRHTVTAPFDAIVRDRLVDPGAWVNPGEVLLNLVGTAPPEIFVDVPADVVGALEEGQRLKVHSAPEVEAEILGIVRALDAMTRTATIRLRPLSTHAWLMPGRSVEVTFETRRDAPGAVVIARDALKRGPVSTRVFAVDEDGATVRLLEVELLAVDEAQALVRGEGLSIGDRVITRGNERLRPGQRVRADVGEGPTSAESRLE